MLKVIVALAVVAVLAGVGTRWARDKGETLLHHALDTSLPGKIDGHRWTPVRDGRTLRADRVRFAEGRVTTVRCHQTLGTYAVRVNHGFSFTPATAAIRRGCAGRSLRASLRDATRVDVEQLGESQEMTLIGAGGDTVATLISRGD